jgi:hypothetical protein
VRRSRGPASAGGAELSGARADGDDGSDRDPALERARLYGADRPELWHDAVTRHALSPAHLPVCMEALRAHPMDTHWCAPAAAAAAARRAAPRCTMHESSALTTRRGGCSFLQMATCLAGAAPSLATALQLLAALCADPHLSKEQRAIARGLKAAAHLVRARASSASALRA